MSLLEMIQKIAEAREAARLPLPDDAPWWWLSFADAERFRGLVITRGTSFIDAVARTHKLGISPGGQVAGSEIPPRVLAMLLPEVRDRLLSKEEAEALAALTDAVD